MSATSTPVRVRIDAALEQVQRHRERALTETAGPRRAALIAELYEREARLWSALFSHTRIRVHWRAALAAEAYARQRARSWRRAAEAATPLDFTDGEIDEWADRFHTELRGGVA
ncbi:MAG: hypothetical protein GEU83_18205 [Pseudonocardiaceae bacterium]|nr:hypothetical protein [Pseudonocardiaceae bacterium]